MASFRDPRLPPEWSAIIEQAMRERARAQEAAVRTGISSVQATFGVRALGAAIANALRTLSGYPAASPNPPARR